MGRARGPGGNFGSAIAWSFGRRKATHRIQKNGNKIRRSKTTANNAVDILWVLFNKYVMARRVFICVME